jgi:Spx/MgsR family transcriptional regulator
VTDLRIALSKSISTQYGFHLLNFSGTELGAEMFELYGIPNCDTVKKAMKKLKEQGIDYEFHNFKKETPTKKDIKRWKSAYGDWPVNKKGRTYKQLKDDLESASSSEMENLIMENTSLIKRPILEENGEVISFGFDEEVYEGLV